MKNIRAVMAGLLAILVFSSLCGCGKQKNNDEKPKKNDEISDNEAKDVETEKGDLSVNESNSVLGFKSSGLEKAVAECFGKKVSELTEDDVLGVRYLAIGPEADGTNTVYVGLKDYADNALAENVNIEDLKKYVKTATIDNVSNLESDLSKFENIEIFEYYDFEVDDVSFLKNYPILIFGYFRNNGITDVSSLADYAPETLRCIDFTGNDVEDWSYLYNIKEKVVVNYEVKAMTNSDGEIVEIPMETRLSEILESENNDETTSVPDEDVSGYEDIDWSILFD